MKQSTSLRSIWVAAGLVAGAAAALGGPARAALMTYTDSAAFQAGLSAAGLSATTLDFESQVGGDTTTLGTTIGDGGTLGGITFNYPVLAGFGVTMEVRKDFDTTSGQNALGTDDGGVFQGGDSFDLSFGPVNALGMFFIFAPDPLFDDDITLSAGGGSVGLVAADLQQTLPDGGLVYFLGLIDDAATFTSAGVAGSGPFFLYTVDDITTAVAGAVIAAPEPASLPLMALGLLGLWGATRRRRDGA